jgi:hypothetical protein
MSMEQFLSLVQRPQFASITSIVLPDQADLGPDGLEQLAQACPLLKDIELGHENTSIKATDKQILSLPRLFPHLPTAGLNMINLTNRGICGFLRRMGPRLLEIKIRSISLLRSNMLWIYSFVPVVSCFPTLSTSRPLNVIWILRIPMILLCRSPPQFFIDTRP